MARSAVSDVKKYPELKRLLFNPTNKDYLTLYELEKVIEPHLFDRTKDIETYNDSGAGEIILNYDIQYKKQIDEINELHDYLEGGILMDDKDITILKNDIGKEFDKSVTKIVDIVSDELSGMQKRIANIESESKQNCEDGKCVAKSLTEIQEEIGNLNKNIKSISDDKFVDMQKSIDGVCTGIDCINKKFEEDDTVTCPECNTTFVWNDNITNCPHCGVALGIE